ncbi:hypothetical protein C7S16_1136 [Burkholderia thailandensis]|uniref:Uncharacterized protein n=1 Tax=Burkholderia thailandensis TaxID=57975 RepID=A0AAW9D4R4_BURTH|nr:hypothetical protein [Burkholderia thailandensis]
MRRPHRPRRPRQRGKCRSPPPAQRSFRRAGNPRAPLSPTRRPIERARPDGTPPRPNAGMNKTNTALHR